MLVVVYGRLAQMVERPLRMREVGGSIPPMSNFFTFIPNEPQVYHHKTVYYTYTKHDQNIFYLSTHVRYTTSNYINCCWYCRPMQLDIYYTTANPSSQHHSKIPTNADIPTHFSCTYHNAFVYYTSTLYTQGRVL